MIPAATSCKSRTNLPACALPPGARCIIVMALLCLIGRSGDAIAGEEDSTAGGFLREAISISGDIGTYGEWYSIAGRERRRPSGSARLYFRPTVSLFNSVSMSFNFLLSTEGNSQRQQINQLGVSPRWSWGYAHIGDFSESYTPLTLNGVMIRGGGITINPGVFRFSTVGGFTRRSVIGSSGGGSFERYLYGGRIGVGEERESYIDLLFVRARDVPSSFEQAAPDTLPVMDSTQVGTLVNTLTESPQENLVLGMTGALSLFDRTVRITGEVNGSAFTRDMRSSPLENERIPTAVTSLFVPRVSTSADYAYTTGVAVDLHPVRVKGGYRYIGPGYVSLGTASLINDQREFSVGTALQLPGWSVRLDWSRQNDNLIDQKQYTTIRHRYNGSITFRPVTVWSVTVVGNYLNMRNHAANDTVRIDFSTVSIGTNQVVMTGSEGVFRTVALQYLFSRSDDGNPLRLNSGYRSHTVSVTSPLVVAQNLTMNASVNLVISRFGAQAFTGTQSYILTPQYRAHDGALSVSLSLGLTRAPGTTSLLATLLSQLRLSPVDVVSLSLRRTGFTSGQVMAGDYQEYVASLTLSHRF
jgi:hypothetical protein